MKSDTNITGCGGHVDVLNEILVVALVICIIEMNIWTSMIKLYFLDWLMCQFVCIQHIRVDINMSDVLYTITSWNKNNDYN
uniref:Uncharacterized protein n=1 Tax=Salix viminalis TaxID=40686 RepID=A0A6N2LNC8_SALVM